MNYPENEEVSEKPVRVTLNASLCPVVIVH
jgi:hypothetical protein